MRLEGVDAPAPSLARLGEGVAKRYLLTGFKAQLYGPLHPHQVVEAHLLDSPQQGRTRAYAPIRLDQDIARGLLGICLLYTSDAADE